MNKKNNEKKIILVTGSAGFIGYHLSKKLLDEGFVVVGVDNLNDYYDVQLKLDRLEQLKLYKDFDFFKIDISDKESLEKVFADVRPQIVVNLAAQAGVRYSITNPEAYISSNLVGFFNILECCRYNMVEHLVYASSSSVYGSNKKVPYSVEDRVDNPVSLYAATKKSNELMAHAYSKLYGIPATGLRFFTVYGPFGRPDMAYFSFTNKILAGETIKIFNNGDLYRDFTYIDDIIQGMMRIIPNPPVENKDGVRYKVYNIGNNKPENLLHFVEVLEMCLGKKADKEFLPMQQGDVYQTFADVSDLERDFGFKPDTSLEDGLTKFVEWYNQYMK
ncbi:MAG: SDR family NAD(P)-dependent oxidoreductase [Clostridium sp.]|nr:SDR family NAD(P)-dependent oxidoreductase [Clostridium sp.]